MATNCEDVSAQMMDLLYGELSLDARAGVDEHVAGCARCRAELEGFERTRALARQGLDEAPPVRARVAIVKAAAEHLAAARTQPAARRSAAPERVSFWDRLRAKWVLPTFATVGAVAVFAIANRVFLNPERAMDQLHGAGAPEAPAVAVAPAPGEPQGKSEAANSAEAQRDLDRQLDRKIGPAGPERFDETAQRGAGFEGHGGKKALDATGAEQKPPPARPPSVVGGGGDLAKDIADKAHVAPKGSARASRMSDDATVDNLMDERPKPAAEAEKEKPYRAEPRARTQFAPPPPPREAAAPAKQGGKAADKTSATKEEAGDYEAKKVEPAAPAPRRAAPAKPMASPPPVGVLDNAPRSDAEAARGASVGGGGLAVPKNKADGFGSGAAQAAPQPTLRNETTTTKRPAPAAPPATAAPPPPSPSTPASPSKARAKSAEDAEGVPLMQEESNAKTEKKKASGRANAIETLAQRADRLFTEGHWSQAAEAYRELLRKDPRNDDADRWRQRLTVAESADASERNESVAERRASEKRAKKAAEPKAAAKPSAGKEAAGAATVDQ